MTPVSLYSAGPGLPIRMARGSAGGGGDRLANFVQGDRIKPYVSSDLEAVIVAPIKFRAPNGSIAYGYDAEALHAQVFVASARRPRRGHRAHGGERAGGKRQRRTQNSFT
jgi:hypothetical protein